MFQIKMEKFRKKLKQIPIQMLWIENWNTTLF